MQHNFLLHFMFNCSLLVLRILAIEHFFFSLWPNNERSWLMMLMTIIPIKLASCFKLKLFFLYFLLFHLHSNQLKQQEKKKKGEYIAGMRWNERRKEKIGTEKRGNSFLACSYHWKKKNISVRFVFFVCNFW